MKAKATIIALIVLTLNVTGSVGISKDLLPASSKNLNYRTDSTTDKFFKGKHRLVLVKRGKKSKIIRPNMKVKFWIDSSDAYIKGKYEVIDSTTISVNGVSYPIEDIRRISTVNAQSIIGLTLILGGSALLIAIPVEGYIVLFSGMFGSEQKEMKNGDRNFMLGLAFIAVGEWIGGHLLDKKINEKYELVIK